MDIEIKDLHCSLRMPGDPENQAPESPQTASSSTQQSAVLIPRSGPPPFPPFDPLSNPANTGPRWRKWLRRFENLLISLCETHPIVKRGLLLTYVGETTNDIFDTLPSTGTDYAAAVESLTQRFDPSPNKDIRQITQESGETINEFCRLLKEKSNSCKFTNAEAEIRTQIIHKTFIYLFIYLFNFATRAGSPQQREPITVGPYYLPTLR